MCINNCCLVARDIIFVMNRLLLTGALGVLLCLFTPTGSVFALEGALGGNADGSNYTTAQGQGGQEGSGLVPCGYGETYDCGTDDAITLANNVISFLIKMMSVIAVIAIVITGFQMVTSGGDTKAWNAGKSRLIAIVIGIIIILSAFLVVDTILKALTDKGLEETSGGIVNTGSN